MITPTYTRTSEATCHRKVIYKIIDKKKEQKHDDADVKAVIRHNTQVRVQHVNTEVHR